jgi:four helix bundle protein
VEFPFEKLRVYQLAQQFNLQMQAVVRERRIYAHPSLEQISRSALSIPLNIAEGYGRFSGPDRRRFYRIALGSTFECVPTLEVLLQNEFIDKVKLSDCRESLRAIAAMLTVMVKQS